MLGLQTFVSLFCLNMAVTILGSVVEPDPEPLGAKTFGRNRCWSRYTEVSAPAQTKVVH
jgi:hypothetical protein